MNAFPSSGIAWSSIERQLLGAKAGDSDWKHGRVPYYIYYRDEELLEVQTKAYNMYLIENALSARGAFPSLGRLQDEIFEMAFDLFHAPSTAGANFTSGGTESVFQAIKTARDRSRAERPTLERPNIVAAYSRHPSVDKAAHLMGLELRVIPVDGDARADVDAMGHAIDEQTVLLYSSATCFPYGVFDPIERLAAIATDRGVRLHVDACFGGFVAPFAKELGYPVPNFDLAVPGVSSLSADLHKFGFGCKGASLLLFADRSDLEFSRYEVPDLASGPYVTPTFAGSKPGGPIAAAWAVMHFLGRDGYREHARVIMETTTKLIDGIDSIEGLSVYQPNGEANLFRYTVDGEGFNIYAIAELMTERGWLIGQHRTPPAIHHAINPVHEQIVDPYLTDLAQATGIARRKGLTRDFAKRTY